jgi:carboxypeptidase Taq
MPSTTFDEYLKKSRTLSDISAAVSVLNWDQEIYMPHGAAEARAEQIATLSALLHQMNTAPDYRAMIEELKNDSTNGTLDDWQKAAVRESARSQDLALKLPEEHVRELSRVESLAQHAWKQARAESNFSIFAPLLKQLVELKRREADYYGFKENRYDALIDLFEPGMTVSQLRPVFERLREGTMRLLKKIADSGNDVSDAILFTDFNRDTQLKFATETITHLGFDFTRGRVDLSTHPFCTSFSINDVRLTTRIYADDLRSCLFGLIHEAGHGMYEQGIDQKMERSSVADGTSMGIHESQSLLWENTVARSEAFWQWAFPKIQQTFPEKLGSMNAYEFYQAINVMKPSFIRVEADELTYNLHIILRFEIEEALINGTMEVDDIPSVWNRKMQEYLGLTPKNDAEGCLQDVHWSFGGFGYFPSYTLGKLYAAMFIRQAHSDIPGLTDMMARGEFGSLLAWLREKIHHWGKAKTASELVMDICGRPLTEEDFLRYVEDKIDRVYYGVEQTEGVNP